MDKKLYLSILWHQHQPYYKDDLDDKYYMPWVYLHAIKDYYDMARHVEVAANNIKVTFNYVPSLLVQLKDYFSIDVKDNFISILRKPVSSLSHDERKEILNQSFMANTEKMIKPIKRFYSLYELQASHSGDMNVFNNDDILDIEVLYLLSWCGQFLIKEDDLIASLISKGSGFTEDDKLSLLNSLSIWVQKVIEIHKRLAESGKIELSTTPFYHPITPLLIDTKSTHEVASHLTLPEIKIEPMEDDAKTQLLEGLEEFKSTFGFSAKGLWPAEGSISKRAVELWASNGISWIASDEDVLGNSLGTDLKDPKNRHRLYMRRFKIFEGKKIYLFFRDKFLSDLIGFTYSTWNPNDAVEDFINHLKNIYNSYNFSTHVSVILDGENAWEYYNNNAYDFFTTLYKRLSEESFIKLATFNESMCNNDIPEEVITNIKAGSWIMGNFKIWIGHEEKNRAWELISKAKTAINYNIDKVDKQASKQIAKELHIAEGSDWFWWFGDDHYTLQADLFDKLFRTHLINIYKLLKINVPGELYIPIKTSKNISNITKPSSYICPNISSNYSTFYEWLPAGEYDLKSDATSMHAGSDYLKNLFYGYNDDNLFLKIENKLPHNNMFKLEILLTSVDGNIYSFIADTKQGYQKLNNGFEINYEADIRVSIYIKNIKELKTKIYLQLILYDVDKVIEKAPLYMPIEIDLSETFDNEWLA